MTRIYSLGLLPPTIIAMEGEDINAATRRLPKPSARKSSSATNIVSRVFNRCGPGT